MLRGTMTINQRTARILRIAGLLAPLALFGYGLLIHAGILFSSNFSGLVPFLLGMGAWLIIALAQYFMPIAHRYEAAFYLAAYHLFGAFFVVFVSGFTTPFSVAWVILMVAAYAYFAARGLTLSITTLAATVALDVLLHSDGGYSLLLTSALTLTGVTIAGLTAVAISRVQEIDGAELHRSKALETLQRDRILTIINNLADAVLSTDEDGVVRVYNAASLNLLDTNTSLNGQHLDEIIELSDANGKAVLLYDMISQSKGTVVRDDLILSLEGETLRLEVTFSPIRSNYSKSRQRQVNDGYIIILRDITAAKSLEEERDEFISVVSHELRTPITIAEGTISNVQVMMDRPEIAKDVLSQGITTAHDQILYLSKMVNDLSTLSRAERGVADTAEPIDVRELVDDLYHEYAPQAEAKQLQFNLDVAAHPGTVTVSRLYLKELLQNFITNALKYTKEGGITLSVSRSSDGAITFSLRDTGIGISKTDQAKVFNKFYRSEDYRTRETSGTGLGLYVATKLAKKLDTHVKLTSRLNHGSTFSFTLPGNPKND